MRGASEVNGELLCGADPGFGGDQVEGETDPEGGAEEFTRGEWVKRLVAKKMPTMGRMVATAEPTEKARIIHWRCSAISRRRMCQKALQSAKRKNEPKRVVAAAWFTPPIAGMAKLMMSAVMPMMRAQQTNTRPLRRCHRKWRARIVELNCSGPRIMKRMPGTM